MNTSTEQNKSNQSSDQNSVNKTKKRRSFKRKRKNFNNNKFELEDQQTKKIIDSFKNSKIVFKNNNNNNNNNSNHTKLDKKSPKAGKGKKESTSASNKRKYVKKEPKTEEATTSNGKPNVTANSGPYVKLNKERVNLGNGASIEYPMYIVKNHSVLANQNDYLDTGKVHNDKNYKIYVPKEKPAPIVTSHNAQPWLCSMCLNRPNCLPTLGDLFGPYRVSSDYEFDVNMDDVNSNNHNDSINENNFNEIWLHEGCAVWSPNIYVKNNRVYGIASAMKTALDLKCFCCKKLGASLICKHTSCNRVYHYPCAIKNDCKFNEENFTILCKLHSNSSD